MDYPLRSLEAELRLMTVNNQSCIGRKILLPLELHDVNARLAQLLTAEGIFISSLRHCPHQPDLHCTCRKHGPRMFNDANRLYSVDWHYLNMVGDKPSDVESGLSLGLLFVLVTAGYGSEYAEWANGKGVMDVASRADFASHILG